MQLDLFSYILPNFVSRITFLLGRLACTAEPPLANQTTRYSSPALSRYTDHDVRSEAPI